jgi:hypothetical protein
MSKDNTTAKRIGPMRTAIDCRRELAKTYRQYRQGDISDQTAKTSGYLLKILVGMIRDHELATEVADMRQKLENMKNGVTR